MTMEKRPVYMELNQKEVAQVYSLSLPKAQQQCIYLMRKRWSLERAIEGLQNDKEQMRIKVANRDRMIESVKKQADTQLQVSNQNVERLNAKNQEHIAEIQRLEGVIRNGNLG